MARGKDLELLKATLPEDWADVPILSFSQLNTADRCSFKWYISYHMKLRSAKKKVALDKGVFAHTMLESMYRAFIEEGMSSREWAAERLPRITMEVIESLEFHDQIVEVSAAMVLVERYCQTDVFGGHTPVGTEEHFFSMCETPKGRKFILQGYVDLITVDQRDRVWVWDHKTTSKMWTPVQLMMDPQLPIYQMLLRNEGIPAYGLCINQLNSYAYKDMAAQPNEKLFKREFMFRSEPELQSIWREFMQMAEDTIELMTGERIIRRSLKKDCSMCDMNVPCLENLKGTPLEVATEEFNSSVVRVRNIEAGSGVELDLS